MRYRQSSRLFSAAALAALIVSACGSTDRDGSATFAEGSNTAGKDVTVLQAWIGGTVMVGNSYVREDYQLKPSDCVTLSRQTYDSSSNGTYSHVVGDCRAALRRAAKLDNFAGESPLLGDAVHTWEETDHGIYTRTGRCELVEWRTLIANDVLNQPSFTGLGFYVGNDRGGSEHFVGKDALHKVGDVTLKDGRPGSVHRFFAQGSCFGLGGNGGSLSVRHYLFKPFARFVDGGRTYNVWDDVQDYLLGRSRSGAWVERFDRQSELLGR